eukprot:1140664-Pelagomonas_calceolata.AAC.1
MELPGWSCAASYYFITSHAAEYPMARTDQDSFRAAGGAFSLIRNTGVKEVMLGQAVCTAVTMLRMTGHWQPERIWMT